MWGLKALSVGLKAPYVGAEGSFGWAEGSLRRPVSQIVVEDLVKHFQVAERRPGLWGAVRGLYQTLVGAPSFSIYPRPLFAGFLKIVLFTLIPAGFIGYLPVELLRDFEWTGLLSAVLGAVGYAALALAVFAVGLRRYESGNRFGARV